MFSSMHRPSFDCPVCGETVPANAKSCPECGACDKSGWSGHAAYDALGLPAGEFDYEKFAEEELDGGRRKSGREWLWWIVAVIVLIALACWGLGR